MTKEQAKQAFGGHYRGLAAALDLTSSAISQWPEELTQEQEDRVVGAAVRLGRYGVLRHIMEANGQSFP